MLKLEGYFVVRNRKVALLLKQKLALLLRTGGFVVENRNVVLLLKTEGLLRFFVFFF